ncbi:hypothetical protein Ahy_A10g049692 [Arachis hypogaea]|uniref:Uncharacterized protein n=1 Tax=Arachis hypogaea TaxID=3818 RepID=A0A445B7P5_ARAHY|nr:hypothetical protein Ahy_A10g049692 [Arachis hypogaea]
MLKQHKELSMSMRRTIENNEKAEIKPSKIDQSFVAVAGGHRELNFIEKNMRNYITREVQNVLELDDAKEFEKYLLRIKEKNQNFFFELELEVDQSIKIAFWADARSKAACEYFEYVISFNTTYNTNRNWNGFLIKYGFRDNKWLSVKRNISHRPLSALSFERVNKVSPRYILERWSKNRERRYTHIKSSYDEPLL